ncbi:hypothetical protein NMG60_11025550 [Bertholletia excelsa]
MELSELFSAIIFVQLPPHFVGISDQNSNTPRFAGKDRTMGTNLQGYHLLWPDLPTFSQLHGGGGRRTCLVVSLGVMVEKHNELAASCNDSPANSMGNDY